MSTAMLLWHCCGANCAGWNILDAAVVILGFIGLANIGNYSALRAVRVLRPLRTITKIKGLRTPVVTLLKSLPMLSNVAMLCLFAFFIFGIVAVQLFAGALQYRWVHGYGACTLMLMLYSIGNVRPAIVVVDNISALTSAFSLQVWHC